MGANQGFLRPTGNLARREKTVPSPAPSQVGGRHLVPPTTFGRGLTNSSAPSSAGRAAFSPDPGQGDEDPPHPPRCSRFPNRHR